MTSSDRFCILAAWIEYRFKKHGFPLSKILVKPRDSVVKPRGSVLKHYINFLYMGIVKYSSAIHDFEIIFISSFWNKNF